MNTPPTGKMPVGPVEQPNDFRSHFNFVRQDLCYNTRMMSKISLLTFLVFATLAFALRGDEFQGLQYSTAGDVVPGVWNTQYDSCVKAALSGPRPMVVVWLRSTCSRSKSLARALAAQKVTDWGKQRGYVFLLGIEGKVGDSHVHTLAKEGTNLPFVGFYRGDKNGDGKLTSADSLWRGTGRSGKMTLTKGSLAQQFMDSADAYLLGSGSGETPARQPLMEITKTMTFSGFATCGSMNTTSALELKIAKGGKMTAYVKLPASSKKPFSLKKYKFTGALAADGTATLACSRHVGQMVLRVDMTAATGTVEHDGQRYDCSLTVTSAAAKAAVSVFKNTAWVLALRTTSRPEAFVNGYSALSVTVKKSGKAKIYGFLADGTKVSVSSVGQVVDGALVVPVNAPLYKNKAGGFSLTLRLGLSGAVTVDRASNWISLANGSRADVAWGEILGSSVGLFPQGSELQFVASDVPPGLAADTVFSEKTSYSSKTGLFKGSFYLLTSDDKKRAKKKATVNGAVVKGVGYGSAVIKKYGSLPVTVGK